MHYVSGAAICTPRERQGLTQRALAARLQGRGDLYAYCNRHGLFRMRI